MTAAAPAQTPQNAGSDAEVVVRVYDHANLPNNILTKALREAEKVFRLARVETSWLDCSARHAPAPNGCISDTAPNKLRLRVFARATSSRYAHPATALGFATLPPDGGFGVEASVYSRRALSQAEEWQQPRGSILGHAMAHEVGHLLLGTRGHALNGIMTSNWGPREFRLAAMGMLRFRPRHAESIRGNIAARAQAKPGYAHLSIAH